LYIEKVTPFWVRRFLVKKVIFSILSYFALGFLLGCNSTTEYLDTTQIKVDPTLEIYEQKKQMPPFDLDVLFKADHIVIGTVTGVLPAYYHDDNLTDNPHAITNVVINVRETLKGDHYDQIAVMRVGGIAEKKNGEIVQVLTNAPHYSKDEEVLLFLKNFNVYDPPKGFRNNNHFYLKAYGKWGSDSEKFTLDYEGVISEMTIEELRGNLKVDK